eukprot:7955789-Alexandrium_andersonii.AAC.1
MLVAVTPGAAHASVFQGERSGNRRTRPEHRKGHHQRAKQKIGSICPGGSRRGHPHFCAGPRGAVGPLAPRDLRPGV